MALVLCHRKEQIVSWAGQMEGEVEEMDYGDYRESLEGGGGVVGWVVVKKIGIDNPLQPPFVPLPSSTVCTYY